MKNKMPLSVWKEELEQKHDLRFLFPVSENFYPVTTPVFQYNGDVYAVKSKQFDSLLHFEQYLNENDDVALMYITRKYDSKDAVIARFCHLDRDTITHWIAVDSFFEKYEHVLGSPPNKNRTSKEDVIQQIENMDHELGMIHIAKFTKPGYMTVQKIVAQKSQQLLALHA